MSVECLLLWPLVNVYKLLLVFFVNIVSFHNSQQRRHMTVWHATQERRSTQFSIVKFQILCVSTAETALHINFDIFSYLHDLKVFNNHIAFK